MAGRLRRRADRSWEVKLNDTGVRLLQATVDAPLDEFLAAKDLARRELALAPWTDVNADDPDMCPPFFMQLTRFQGDGGYAVGVSCALLLADPLSLARFLQSWARTHTRMKAQSKAAAHPVASRALGAARASRLSVVVVAPAAGDDGLVGKATIETCTADDGPQAWSGTGGAGTSLEAVQWSELGLEELVLRDSKPVRVSCSIVTAGDEGLVVVMPDGAGSLLVTATLPK
uniref:Uncharacterized protein n=1 Tax=Oryza brachyantha TaxID=4533 RepID=J3LFD5_ORYBR